MLSWVFKKEPYKGNLLKLDNINSIPHIASFTAETRKNGKCIVEKFNRVFKKQK